jgi:SAM-dependent methyltransferase
MNTAVKDDAPSSGNPWLANLLRCERTCLEAIRTLLQGELYDPLTRRFLKEAGLRRGMKVLDLGSGLGSVAIQAAELVGPTGTVLGIELDPALVELSTRRARSAGKSNITFLRGDVDSPFLLELLKPHYGRFDAIIGRFLLRELKDAGESLPASGVAAALEERHPGHSGEDPDPLRAERAAATRGRARPPVDGRGPAPRWRRAGDGRAARAALLGGGAQGSQAPLRCAGRPRREVGRL